MKPDGLNVVESVSDIANICALCNFFVAAGDWSVLGSPCLIASWAYCIICVVFFFKNSIDNFFFKNVGGWREGEVELKLAFLLERVYIIHNNFE